MLEDFKLSFFKGKIAGFAYEFGYEKGEYILQIYLVVGKEDSYGFIKFRKSKFIQKQTMESLIETMDKYGYMPINNWLTMGNSDKQLAKRPRTRYEQVPKFK